MSKYFVGTEANNQTTFESLTTSEVLDDLQLNTTDSPTFAALDINGSVTATSFIKSGGTTNQFLKANGNVDGTAYAPLASPALTGNPTAPTQASSENSTKIATTAYVKSQGYVTSDTNTTYSAGTHLALSGTTFNLDLATTDKVLNIGHNATTNNEGEIILDTSNAGSPQIGFTEHGDASWAIGVDDGDNSFKIHGNANTTIPTINNLSTPLFEVTTTAGTAYLNNNRIFHAGHHPNADTLTTARTIAGTSFNGSANIDISYNNLTNKPTIPSAYSLPEATATVRGGIELFSNTDQSVAANSVSATASRTYGIQLNSAGQAVVNVPWSDTNTQLTSSEVRANISGTGLISYNSSTGVISTTANNYSLPEATATVRGGIELFSNTDQSVAANSVSATAGRTYGIQLNSAGQAVVNVPWSDTNTDTNTFRAVTAGGNTLGSGETLALTAGSNVSISEAGGQVTISSTDTNTVYSHPTHNGDDINIDTGALTGATVISDLDFNITTNSLGHVTDANGAVSTRTLTAANLGISAPNAPASASVAIVGETVEVTFAASTTSNIDAYLVYSSIDGSDYGLISIVPPDDFAASMSIIDNAFDETGTQAYRVYAVKYGILSSATTASVSYTVSSAEPTSMSVVNLNNAYYVQWNPPSSNARFVTAYNVYKHEHATQGSLSRGSASLVYSGMNTNYMYQISGTNNNNFHQFWVETTIA